MTGPGPLLDLFAGGGLIHEISFWKGNGRQASTHPLRPCPLFDPCCHGGGLKPP